MSYFVSEKEVYEHDIGTIRTMLFSSPEGRFTITFQARFFYFDKGRVSEEHKAKLREYVKAHYDDESGTPVEINSALLKDIFGE
jgi:hypothetical protein